MWNVRVVYFGDSLPFGIAWTSNLGDFLIIGIVRTIDLGYYLLIGLPAQLI